MRIARAFSSCLLLLFLSLPCAAQTLLPVIQLSAEESATAKQLAQTLKDADERSASAKAAFQQFHQLYQSTHPNLPDLRFTDDARFAVATMHSSIRGFYPLASIELTAEEHQKLQTLVREMAQSDEAKKQAENNWGDFEVQLVLKHIGRSKNGAGSSVTLSSGAGGSIPVPYPWTGELAFTSDFKLATPLPHL
jgi:hypothetical protein